MLSVTPKVFIPLYSNFVYDSSHIEDVHLLFCAHFINSFSFFGDVELKTFFLSKMFRWCVVCVICNSNSFHSFLLKLCIMIVLYTFDKYFLTF